MNERGFKKEKFQFHVNLEFDDAANLRTICREQGITKTEFVKRAIRNEIFQMHYHDLAYKDYSEIEE